MEVNKILSADVLDIIFEGRNKEYGAYDLRKTYNKRLTTSLLIVGALCLLLFIGYLASTLLANDETSKKVDVKDVELAEIKQEEKKEEPPPPAPRGSRRQAIANCG